MKKPVNIIFHIDMNAFFASVEMIENPQLKQKVFAVGGGLNFFRGGILTTASYKARKYGIRSGMSITEALNLYPKLIVVPNRHDVYRKYSKLFIDYLKTYTHLVLQASIDEAYMDVTNIKDIHPLELAKKIQKDLMNQYQLPSSIGIGPTLFLAKMASDMKKPMGITVLRKRDLEMKLYPLSIKEMFGIGKKTYPRLERLGIHKISDFIAPENKEKILSIMSEKSYFSYISDLKGESNNIVDPKKYAIPKSISNETTFSFDTDVEAVIIEHMKDLVNETYERMKSDQMVAKTIGIKIRYGNFKTVQRSFTLPEHTENKPVILEHVLNMFDEVYTERPVRLVGVSLGQLELKQSLKKAYDLFSYQNEVEQKNKINETIEVLNLKYGKNTIKKT
ncbi:MAG: DNA polymerase IV [Acholeplasma sp.]|nr:DNA polymerase IV [Acholeplasma sp.]